MLKSRHNSREKRLNAGRGRDTGCKCSTLRVRGEFASAQGCLGKLDEQQYIIDCADVPVNRPGRFVGSADAVVELDERKVIPLVELDERKVIPLRNLQDVTLGSTETET